MSLLPEHIVEDWNERPKSEKNIIIVVSGLMILTLLYLFVAEPLINWREKEQRSLVANTKVLSQVEGLVQRFENQKAAGAQAQKGLAQVIDQSLQANGLAMRGFQPGKNNDARLRLTNVKYEPLVQWLYDIEYQHKLVIEELSVSETKTQGLLLANIRVRQ